MPIEVEVETGVFRFLARNCTPKERAEFYDLVHALEVEPIKNSDPCYEPKLSPYMLRFFRFGANKAIFELDAFKNRIRVLECQRLKLSSLLPGPHMEGGPRHA